MRFRKEIGEVREDQRERERKNKEWIDQSSLSIAEVSLTRFQEQSEK